MGHWIRHRGGKHKAMPDQGQNGSLEYLFPLNNRRPERVSLIAFQNLVLCIQHELQRPDHAGQVKVSTIIYAKTPRRTDIAATETLNISANSSIGLPR